MEHYPITYDGSQLKVEGIPDAVKLVESTGPKSKRLGDLFLHLQDLQFALSCLESIDSAPEDGVFRESLWRSAITHFCKCFGSSISRFSLDYKNVYVAEPIALIVFDYFKNLRDKHIIHDENALSQCVIGLALNDGGKTYNIERVVCFASEAATLEQESYSNLYNLVSYAIKWLENQFHRLAKVISDEAELEGREALENRSLLQQRMPKVNEVGESRNRFSSGEGEEWLTIKTITLP